MRSHQGPMHILCYVLEESGKVPVAQIIEDIRDLALIWILSVGSARVFSRVSALDEVCKGASGKHGCEEEGELLA